MNGFRPIGQYGNGFKSGSMRMGKDAIVFTQNKKTKSCGLLSQTYLKEIGAETVLVPIVTWDLQNKRCGKEEGTKNLSEIVSHTFFLSEDDLLKEFITLEKNSTKSGTKIIIYNLHKGSDGKLELDFESDSLDIRNPESHVFDYSTINRPIQIYSPEYTKSLREYCSILFLKPRMKIILRGKKVKTKLVSKSLSQEAIDQYKPSWLKKPCHIKFGFTCSKNREDYGLMMYNNNRLIKAYEKIGYQKQIQTNGGEGIGVVGVVEVDFLKPTHNKQDFVPNNVYNSFMSSVSQKLNDYWNEKKNNSSVDRSEGNKPDWTWVQCDNSKCQKWRRMPDGICHDGLPDRWYCYMNPDASHNRCDIPEEPEDEDEALKRPYEKKVKKEKKRERERLRIRLDKLGLQTKNNSYVASLKKQLDDTKKRLKNLESKKQESKEEHDKLYNKAQNVRIVGLQGNATVGSLDEAAGNQGDMLIVKTESGEVLTIVKNKTESCIDLTMSDHEDDDRSSTAQRIKTEPNENDDAGHSFIHSENENMPSTSQDLPSDINGHPSASLPKKRKVTDNSEEDVKPCIDELGNVINSHHTPHLDNKDSSSDLTGKTTQSSVIDGHGKQMANGSYKDKELKDMKQQLDNKITKIKSLEKELSNLQTNRNKRVVALENKAAELENKCKDMTTKYSELTRNVKKLIGIVVPDIDLGDIDDINEIVCEMIKVNGES